MKITVRTLTGKEIAIEPVENETTVGEIKVKVEEQEGIPPPQQRLIFGGKQMADDKALADYGIVNNVQLHLVLALRGGN